MIEYFKGVRLATVYISVAAPKDDAFRLWNCSESRGSDLPRSFKLLLAMRGYSRMPLLSEKFIPVQVPPLRLTRNDCFPLQTQLSTSMWRKKPESSHVADVKHTGRFLVHSSSGKRLENCRS